MESFSVGIFCFSMVILFLGGLYLLLKLSTEITRFIERKTKSIGKV